MNCARWTELLAAYVAGRASNQSKLDAEETRDEVDDSINRASHDDVAARLREWNRKE